MAKLSTNGMARMRYFRSSSRHAASDERARGSPRGARGLALRMRTPIPSGFISMAARLFSWKPLVNCRAGFGRMRKPRSSAAVGAVAKAADDQFDDDPRLAVRLHVPRQFSDFR